MKNIRYVGLALAFAGSLLLAVSSAQSATLEEKFTTQPTRWVSVGDTNLFHWDSAAGSLGVTWDSSKSNSYFALPLGATVTRQDDFWVSFDIRLSEVAAGINPGKSNPFQLAVGLLNLDAASQPAFLRGTGFSSPDLVEFSYFPDPGGEWMWGPSLTAMMADWTGTNWSRGGFAPLALDTGAVYRVTMIFTALDQKLRTTLTKDGVGFADIDVTQPVETFVNFHVDHLAVMSYSEAGQDPSYSGSILAHGTIDNVVITLPPPPVSNVFGALENGAWKVRFTGRAGWVYRLHRATPGQEPEWWSVVSPDIEGTSGTMTLTDAAPPQGGAFYRVEAARR